MAKVRLLGDPANYGFHSRGGHLNLASCGGSPQTRVLPSRTSFLMGTTWLNMVATNAVLANSDTHEIGLPAK